MRAFTTAAKTPQPIVEGAEPITFQIDGENVTAYPPTAGQMALMVASFGQGHEVTESVAAVVDFLDGILDEDGQALFRRRLLDRNDPFDFDNVQEILEALIEEWTARPTSSPSGSSSSPQNGGSRSTAKRRSGVSPA